MDPLESTHPVLRRHYSTIGIGDVFVQPDESWQLPSVYFAAHAPTLSVQLLDEVIGLIKVTPEDFVVREMAVVQGEVRVADLSLRDTLVSTTITPPTSTTITRPIPPIPTATVAVDRALSSSDAQKAASSTDAPATKENHASHSGLPVSTTSRTSERDEDPIDRLRRVLELYQMVTGDDSPTTLGATAHVDTSANEALAALVALEREALHQLAVDPSQPHGSSENLPRQIYLTLSSSASMHVADQKVRKRELHEALRDAFPLLDAVSGPVDASPDTAGWSTRLHITPDDCFAPLARYLLYPVDDLPPLYAFAKRGYEHSLQQVQRARVHAASASTGIRHSTDRRRCKPGPILRLRPDLPRDDRRPIHQMIDSKSKGLLSTETLNNYPLPIPELPSAALEATGTSTDSVGTTTAILVHWSHVAARKVSKKRSREEHRATGHAPKANYLLCVLRKRKKEHLALINTLAAAFRCRSADIGLAGIKDFQAIAFQFCTLEHFEHQRVLKSTEYLSERGIDIVPLHNVDQALSKGDLVGNRFEITVRNMQRVQLVHDSDGSPSESFVPVDEVHLKQMVRRLQSSGFVNFYGEQRVGEPGHSTVTGVRAFDIGRAMLQRDYFKAIDLLIRGRRLSNGVKMVREDIDAFRLVWEESSDPVATAKQLPPGNTSVPRERAVIKGLVRYGKDNALAALRCLQRNERLFFINGYQSYVWNVMATERIRRYGNKVVVGDLLLLNGAKKPEIATEDLLPESIENVVLPMVGFDVVYPSNEIGELYHQFLARETSSLTKVHPTSPPPRGVIDDWLWPRAI